MNLNSRKKGKQLQIIRTSRSNKSISNEEETHQCQYKRNQQLRRGKFSASERIYYITISNCNSAELQEICGAQEDCEDCTRAEAAWEYKNSIELASQQNNSRFNALVRGEQIRN